jgi:hypothetical protein
LQKYHCLGKQQSLWAFNMQKNIKLGAATLTLAVLISGCAPGVGPNQQAGATGDAYGTTTAPTAGTYGTTTTGAETSTGYNDYSSAGTTGNSYDYSAPGSSTSGGGYSGSYSGGGYSGGGGGSTGSANGSYAVQVIASPNRNTADNMQRNMQSQGFTAVVDQVGGYYKVRIPFASAEEAKSALSRVRSSVPDAFYTVR